MSTALVRSAGERDLVPIVEANRAMARETEGVELDRDRLALGVAAVLADPARGRYLVAEEGGRVVGTTLLTYEWSDWRNGVFWWIQSVHVDAEHRRRGVFRALYERVLDEARRTEGVCGVRLYVEAENRAAREVYARLGMRETSYRMYEVDFVLERRDAERPAAPAAERPAPAAGETDPIAALVREHGELDGLLHSVAEALLDGRSEEGRRRLGRFRDLLLAHARVEEEVLLPLLAAAGSEEPGGRVELYRAEHERLRELTGGLDDALAGLGAEAGPRERTLLIERFVALKHLLEHHDQRERNLLYPSVEAAVPSAERAELRERLRATGWRVG